MFYALSAVRTEDEWRLGGSHFTWHICDPLKGMVRNNLEEMVVKFSFLSDR